MSRDGAGTPKHIAQSEQGERVEAYFTHQTKSKWDADSSAPSQVYWDASETTVREWEGITGRVKQLLEVEGRRVDSKFEAMEKKFEEGKADADIKFEELKGLMKTLLGQNTMT